MTKFKALSFKFGRFFTNTHPQTPSAREGAFCRTTPHRDFSKSYAKFTRTSVAVVVLTAFLFAPNLAQAEQSGWFVGVQGGYNKVRWEREGESAHYTTTQTTNDTYRACSSININTGANLANPNCKTESTNAGKTLAGSAERTQIRETILNIPSADTQRTSTAVESTADFTAAGYTSGQGQAYIQEKFFDAIDNVLQSYWYAYNLNSTSSDTATTYTYDTPVSDSFKGFTAGLLGGYKHFFGGSFGLRFYGLFDFGYYTAKNKLIENQIQSYAANFNADMLYNLLEKDDFAFGVFAGLSAGWMQYMKGGNKLGNAVSFGLNLGLRLNLSSHHSLELFSKINSINSFDNFKENDYTEDGGSTSSRELTWASTNRYTKQLKSNTITIKHKDLDIDRFLSGTQVGLRYIYSF